MGGKAKQLNRLIEAGLGRLVPWGLVVDPDGPLDLLAAIAPQRGPKFAVRSCAVGEDVPGNSQAGRFESLLDVPYPLLPAAVARVARSADRLDPAPKMYVLIQQMVQAYISGVCFTVDLDGPNQHRMVVDWSRDAHAITSGAGGQEFLYYPEQQTVQSSTPYPLQVGPVLPWLDRIHQEFGPSDVEWAVERDGTVHVFQVRSLVASLQGYAVGHLDATATVLVSRVGTELERNLAALDRKVALVLPQTWPEDAPVIERYRDRIEVLICDHGSRTSHPMILARELNLPAIIGVQWGTRVLENGQLINVRAADGRGEISFH